MSGKNLSLFIDSEMLCWGRTPPDNQKPDVIQLGIVSVDNSTLNEVDKERYYVLPSYQNFDVSPFCTKLTGITKRVLLRQGRTLEHTMRLIQQRFGVKSHPTYAWGRDECSLSAACKEQNIDYPWSKRPINNYSDFYHAIRFPESDRRISLTDAVINEYGEESSTKSHDALNDAIDLYLVFKSITKKARMANNDK